MLAAQYGTISDIEIVWVILAAFGMVYSARNAFEAHKDCRALKRAGIKNGRSRIARGARFQDMARGAVHTIFALIGIVAMTIPDSVNAADLPLRIQIVGIVLRWGLIVGSAILVMQSFVSNRLRVELVREERHRIVADLAAEKMQSDVSELTRFATEADDRRLAGPLPEADVTREKEE